MEEVTEQSGELLQLINALMDITEAESGVLPLHRTNVSVRALFEEVADLYELAAEERGVSFSIACGPEVHIHADVVRMRQVIANLVDNAVKFNKRGGVVRLSGAFEGESVRIEVRDEGVGMSAVELERAFDRMYRGEVQPVRRGLGLGLSLVKAVVQAHGATIVAESAGGGLGSLFTIQFPRPATQQGA